MQDWITILISWVPLLLSGGGITALITVVANWLSKNRQNEIEMKKHRMEILSQYVSLYNRLALYTNWNISLYLDKTNIDYLLIMYYVCDFLQLRKRLIHSLGTLQFDNLDADSIINDLERRIIDIIKKEFNEIDFSKLSCLVNDETPYHKFYEKIKENENKELFEKFKKLIDDEKIKTELKQKCKWYSQLIMFELTHIYKIWYNEEPKFSKLDKDLKEMLKENYPKYYKRLEKIG